MAVIETSTSGSSGLVVVSQNTVTTGNITTPGSNPVILIGISLNSSLDSVSSITTTGFGGVTGSRVKNSNANTENMEIWVIVAPPASTTGTITINISASESQWSYSWTVYSGADQTNPCPSGDAVINTTNNISVTLTPTNLTANDATFGAESDRAAISSISPNQRYLDNSPVVSYAAGDATGTTGVTFTNQNTSASGDRVAVRIVSASAGDILMAQACL